MDFVMWNEYWESWYPGSLNDIRRTLRGIEHAFPGKPLVISEYGYLYSYPGFDGGEKRMIEVLNSHTELFREFDFIGGAIFFCYNDYRTQMGDMGTGVLKQRISGVTDLFGRRKRSFDALRSQATPVLLELKEREGQLEASITAQTKLPCYRLVGYRLRWTVFGKWDTPEERFEAELPVLEPGKSVTLLISTGIKHMRWIDFELLRPTGFSAVSTRWKV
jgi:beta-glucuronidase